MSPTPWLQPDELDRLQRSMQRCFADDSFLSRFYARFLLSNDEAAAKFDGIDMKKQTVVLRRSLYLVLRAAHGLEDGLVHLDQIAVSHGEGGLNIGAHLYQHWLDTLLAVVGETDPSYDASLARIWRGALQPCIDRMTGRSAG